MAKRQAFQWFLTYPKCDADDDTILETLKKLGKVTNYLIGHEKHEDGTDHKHVYVKYEKKQTAGTAMDRFDIKKDDKKWHGNYVTVAKPKHCVGYCAKGGEYTTDMLSGYVEECVRVYKKEDKGKLQWSELDKHPGELAEEGRITPFQYKQLLPAYEYKRRIREKMAPIRDDMKKKRHLYLYGVSNTGKTTAVKEFWNTHLGHCYKEATVWKQEGYDFSGYDGEKFVIIEEFEGATTIPTLNKWCDGVSGLPTKGGKATCAQDVTFIITSQYEINYWYNNIDPVVLDAFYNRFIVCEYKKEYKCNDSIKNILNL